MEGIYPSIRPEEYRAHGWTVLDTSGLTLEETVNKSFQTLGNTVQDRNGTKLDLKNCGQYGLLQQCLSFALPRSTWPF